MGDFDWCSGSPRYVLWCCGGICQEDFTFIQIGSGHTVAWVFVINSKILVEYFSLAHSYIKILYSLFIYQSMARANLNKSEVFLKNNTAASKYILRRHRICINWNPPFQTKIYLVKVLLNVNIVKQDLLIKKQFLKIL